MSPAAADDSTRSWTSVSMRSRVRSGQAARPRLQAGRPAPRIPWRIASSMSWLMYATRSTMRTILPSSVSGSTSPVCLRMPSRTSHVRFSVSAIRATARCGESRGRSARAGRRRAPPRRRGRTAYGPCRDRGRPPRSRSSFSRRARATPRAIAVVSSVCVIRVRKWSPAGSMKTCVLPFSRRNAFECRIRSRSRWNGVRTRHSSSSRARPRDSYERTASGDSQPSSCSRIRASKASATVRQARARGRRLTDVAIGLSPARSPSTSPTTTKNAMRPALLVQGESTSTTARSPIERAALASRSTRRSR